jgi:hypothetical protein
MESQMDYVMDAENLGVFAFKSDMSRRAWQSVTLENDAALSFAYLAVVKETIENPEIQKIRHNGGENLRSSLARTVFKALQGIQKNTGKRIATLRQEWIADYSIPADSNLISALGMLEAILDRPVEE